jgi:transposase
MLGLPKPRHLDQPIAVSLEDLVPPTNFYRHLEATLDLGFVREWVTERYAKRGRPSIDPVVFFKLQLVMFFEGIRSERKLVETASLNLAHRWYLGYALDEELPDDSSLTRIRQRLGIGIFERFFEKVVDLCQAAALVWGRELYFDATKVEGNAGIPSLIPRFYYDATTHVAGLFADEADDAACKPMLTFLQASCSYRWIPRTYLLKVIRPGGCWKSGNWIRDVPPSAATGARVTFASAPLTLTLHPCGTGARSASATTTTTSSMVGSVGSSWPPSSPRRTSWRARRCAICSDASASVGRSGGTTTRAMPNTARPRTSSPSNMPGSAPTCP